MVPYEPSSCWATPMDAQDGPEPAEALEFLRSPVGEFLSRRSWGWSIYLGNGLEMDLHPKKSAMIYGKPGKPNEKPSPESSLHHHFDR